MSAPKTGRPKGAEPADEQRGEARRQLDENLAVQGAADDGSSDADGAGDEGLSELEDENVDAFSDEDDDDVIPLPPETLRRGIRGL